MTRQAALTSPERGCSSQLTQNRTALLAQRKVCLRLTPDSSMSPKRSKCCCFRSYTYNNDTCVPIVGYIIPTESEFHPHGVMLGTWNVSHRQVLRIPISQLVNNPGKLRNLRDGAELVEVGHSVGSLGRLEFRAWCWPRPFLFLVHSNVNSLHTRSCCHRLNLSGHGGLKPWAKISLSSLKLCQALITAMQT